MKFLKKFVKGVKRLGLESEIYTGKNGQEALAIIKEQPIEVVICDYNLKNRTMNGTDVLEKIRELHPKIIRIMVTAYGEREIAIEAINKAQIHYFIEKPPEPEKFRNLIYREVLKSREIIPGELN